MPELCACKREFRLTNRCCCHICLSEAYEHRVGALIEPSQSGPTRTRIEQPLKTWKAKVEAHHGNP